MLGADLCQGITTADVREAAAGVAVHCDNGKSRSCGIFEWSSLGMSFVLTT